MSPKEAMKEEIWFWEHYKHLMQSLYTIETHFSISLTKSENQGLRERWEENPKKLCSPIFLKRWWKLDRSYIWWVDSCRILSTSPMWWAASNSSSFICIYYKLIICSPLGYRKDSIGNLPSFLVIFSDNIKEMKFKLGAANIGLCRRSVAITLKIAKATWNRTFAPSLKRTSQTRIVVYKMSACPSWKVKTPNKQFLKGNV